MLHSTFSATFSAAFFAATLGPGSHLLLVGSPAPAVASAVASPGASPVASIGAGAVATAITSIAAADPADWTALPTPSISEPRLVAAHPAPLVNASHLFRSGDILPLRAAALPRLPVATLQKILDEETRARGSRIEFFHGTSALLARGEPPAIEAARALIAELERASEALSIDLTVELVGSGGAGKSASQPASQTAGQEPGKDDAGPEKWTDSRRVQSGEDSFFGLRRTSTFVMSFDVEVAADSGIASPVLGTAAFGRTLHLRAARIDGGKRVHVEGLLDLADLAALDRFDPETPDLGVLQQPALDVVQIAFAGVVDSGGTLEVVVTGAALPRPNWKLTIGATARPDDAGAKDASLDVLDVSLLSTEAAALPPAQPGAELERQSAFAAGSRPAALPPSAIAAALDARSGDGRSGDGGGRPRAYWTDDLLILSRSQPAVRDQARALLAAAEAANSSMYRVEAKRGGLTARFPACAGSPARLVAGRERTALVGYRPEIAPQTWMPSPDVQRTFDGVALDVEVRSSGTECSVWIAESAPPTVLARDDAQLGKMQLLSRSLRSDRARLAPGGPERAFARGAGDAAADALVVRCLAP